MPLASEVMTSQEADGEGVVRLRTRVRTNAGEGRFRRRLAALGLLDRAESIDHYATNWHWTGTGQGYAILWKIGTTIVDLLPLARL